MQGYRRSQGYCYPSPLEGGGGLGTCMRARGLGLAETGRERGHVRSPWDRPCMELLLLLRPLGYLISCVGHCEGTQGAWGGCHGMRVLWRRPTLLGCRSNAYIGHPRVLWYKRYVTSSSKGLERTWSKTTRGSRGERDGRRRGREPHAPNARGWRKRHARWLDDFEVSERPSGEAGLLLHPRNAGALRRGHRRAQRHGQPSQHRRFLRLLLAARLRHLAKPPPSPPSHLPHPLLSSRFPNSKQIMPLQVSFEHPTTHTCARADTHTHVEKRKREAVRCYVRAGLSSWTETSSSTSPCRRTTERIYSSYPPIFLLCLYVIAHVAPCAPCSACASKHCSKRRLPTAATSAQEGTSAPNVRRLAFSVSHESSPCDTHIILLCQPWNPAAYFFPYKLLPSATNARLRNLRRLIFCRASSDAKAQAGPHSNAASRKDGGWK